MMTVELVFPEVAAVVELLRWRIKMLSGGGGESCVFSGESFVRFVSISFVAKGERTFPSPALQVSSGLLLLLATADFVSDWCSFGCWCGLCSLPFVCWGWLMCVQWSQSIEVDGPRCRILQQCPSSWSPWTWRKEIVAGLQFEVAGVENEDGDITGCVRRYQLYWGVSCKKTGVYCMRL
ncbi:unnamed protein product [Urochloa humidicola]